MNFSDDILKSIIEFGAKGYSFYNIALELNMTPDKLRDERMNDEKLNDALNRAEFNADQYRIGKIEETSIGLRSPVQKDVYQRLIHKHTGEIINTQSIVLTSDQLNSILNEYKPK